MLKPWCFNEKGFCCFVTPAKKHSRHWNLHLKRKKSNRLQSFWSLMEIMIWIANPFTLIFNYSNFTSHLHEERACRTLPNLNFAIWFFWSNRSCQINVIKVTHRTCPSVFIHGLTYKAWRRQCWVNITSHEQEWWRQSRASSTSKKWAVVICYESLQVER